MDKLRPLSLIGLITLLSACGGGGGGGSEGGGNTTPPPSPEPNIGHYDGITTAADLEMESISPYLLAVFDGFDFEESLSFEASPMEMHALPVIKQAKSSHLAKERVDEALNCESGSGRISGNLDDDDGTGTLTQEFNSCVISGVEVNGAIIIEFERWNLNTATPADMTFIYDEFSVESQYVGLTVADGQIEIRNNDTCQRSYHFEMNWDNPGSNDDIYYHNFQQNFICENGQDLISMTGQVYIGAFGFVNVTTPEPLALDRYAAQQYYQPYAGHLRLSNELATADITITSREDLYDAPEATITLTHQNNIKEMRIGASLLVDPVYGDLSDSDQDGMPDGWEQFYGLSTRLDDSSEDLDGDGVSNLLEYQTGYAPNESSFSPSAALEAHLHYEGPNDAGFSNLEVGQQASVKIAVGGNVHSGLIDYLSQAGYSIRVDLGSEPGWSFSGPDQCTLELDSPNYILQCENLPLTPFLSEDRGEYKAIDDLVTLTFVPERQGFTQPSLLLTDMLGRLTSRSLETIYIQGADYQVMPHSMLQTLPIGDNPSFATTAVRITGTGSGTPIRVTVSGEIIEAPEGASFAGIEDYQYSLENCVLERLSFSCTTSERPEEDNLYSSETVFFFMLNKPVSTGELRIRYTITTSYEGGTEHVSNTESTVLFGNPAAQLQNLIDASLASDPNSVVTLPSGIYVGSLDTRGAEIVAPADLQLWLTSGDSFYNGDMPGATLSIAANSTLQGGEYFVLSHPIVMSENSTIQDASIHKLSAGSSALELLSSGLIQRNRFMFEAEQQDDNISGMITTCYSCLINIQNNLFVSNLANSPVVNDWGGDGEINLIHNTVVNFSSLLQIGEIPASVYRVENNLFYREQDLPQTNAITGFGGAQISVEGNLLPSIDSHWAGSNVISDAPELSGVGYAPLSSSAAVDAGVTPTTPILDDLNGNLRPVGESYDIGAIEVQSFQ
ncbi:choice-of-anchor Q domain-containing protein [Corallincola platygyrae]|uniref:Choice-of-anchor Q domain-containing protein n=1 Tax=Corallincola platygyrae TaxID=1193278 RepID=A0ABW4XS37_9GAMM